MRRVLRAVIDTIVAIVTAFAIGAIVGGLIVIEYLVYQSGHGRPPKE